MDVRPQSALGTTIAKMTAVECDETNAAATTSVPLVTSPRKDNNKFTCIHCNKIYFVNCLLRRHVKKAHPGQKLPPPLFQYKRTINFGTNIAKMTAKECAETDATAITSLPLVTPLQKHSNKFPCIHCNLVYLENSILRKHVKKAHPDKKLPPPQIQYKRTANIGANHTAEECAETDITAMTSAPLATPPKKDSTKFPCIHCSNVYFANCLLRRHVKKAHPGQKLPPPLIQYKRRANIVANHAKTIAEECAETDTTAMTSVPLATPPKKDSTKFPCIHCNKVYFANCLLRRHVKKAHPDQTLPPRIKECQRKAIFGTNIANTTAKDCAETDATAIISVPLVTPPKKRTNKFPCIHCNKVYLANNILRRHVKNVHPGQKLPPRIKDCQRKTNLAATTVKVTAAECDETEATATTSITLIKPPRKHSKKFPCVHCDKIYTANNLLRRHVKKAHPGQKLPPPLINYTRLANFETNISKTRATECEETEVTAMTVVPMITSPRKDGKTFPCIYCDKVYFANCILRQHVKRVHPEQELPLPLRIYHGTHVRRKYNGIHWITLTFGSLQEFEDWKEREEDLTSTRFIKASGERKSPKHAEYRYKCHRSGFYTPCGTGIRRLRIRGSGKIGANCPAIMVAKVSPSGSCTVFYFNEHKGHTFDVRHLKLRKRQRGELAKKLANGIPLSDMLKELRESAGPNTTYKLHVSRKDLHNIVKEYRINRNLLHRSDRTSINNHTESMRKKRIRRLKTGNTQCQTTESLLTFQSQVHSLSKPPPSLLPQDTNTSSHQFLQPGRSFEEILNSIHSLCSSIEHSCFDQNMAAVAESELKRVQSLMSVSGNPPPLPTHLSSATVGILGKPQMGSRDANLSRQCSRPSTTSYQSSEEVIWNSEVIASDAINTPDIPSATEGPNQLGMGISLYSPGLSSAPIQVTANYANNNSIVATTALNRRTVPVKIIYLPKLKTY